MDIKTLLKVQRMSGQMTMESFNNWIDSEVMELASEALSPKPIEEILPEELKRKADIYRKLKVNYGFSTADIQFILHNYWRM